MGQVTISGVVFDIYGTETGAGSCESYLAGSMSSAAVAWRALGATDDRKRTLVEAARILNSMDWQGTPTQAYPTVQPLVWPRTGVVDGSGQAVDPNTIPLDVINGSYEIAAAVALNADLAAQLSSATGDNVKSMKTKDAAVEFWAPSATGFPAAANRWLGQYLASAAADGTGSGFEGTGTDTESSFDVGDDGDDYSLIRPL